MSGGDGAFAGTFWKERVFITQPQMGHLSRYAMPPDSPK